MKTWCKVGAAAIIALAAGTSIYLAYFGKPVAAPSTEIGNAGEGLAPSGAASGTTTIYRIVPEESEARFSVGEVLNGSPFTAVGATNQIAGEIEVNAANPADSRIGLIRVNARTLKTDSAQRDKAIARFILKSEDPANEFIEFRPSALRGMPARAAERTAFGFELEGDLTISGVTRAAVFRGTALLASAEKITATAEATVKRSDYDLRIPNVPFVASVEDAVALRVTIAAERVAK